MSLEDWQEDQKNRTWCPKRNCKTTPQTFAALKDSTACCAAACSAYKPDSKWPGKNTETDHLGSPTHPNMIQHPYQCPPSIAAKWRYGGVVLTHKYLTTHCLQICECGTQPYKPDLSGWWFQLASKFLLAKANQLHLKTAQHVSMQGQNPVNMFFLF